MTEKYFVPKESGLKLKDFEGIYVHASIMQLQFSGKALF